MGIIKGSAHTSHLAKKTEHEYITLKHKMQAQPGTADEAPGELDLDNATTPRRHPRPRRCLETNDPQVRIGIVISESSVSVLMRRRRFYIWPGRNMTHIVDLDHCDFDLIESTRRVQKRIPSLWDVGGGDTYTPTRSLAQ
ncbi:hypothetical protein CVT26_006394 [Gymnopilus dilepis]|uniref:Uncharacterized protein n=1 Tax=Gymnopilus dilepis TaxID=231916 RepID=A0A409Y0M9_9AGAR|nr:hypothetical protein CVT26_006394 [Gymnopilus dilepis]